MNHTEILAGYNETVLFLKVIFLKCWEHIEISVKPFKTVFINKEFRSVNQ